MLLLKVMAVPAHTLLAEALILIVGITLGVTDMIMPADVSLTVVTQSALLVIIQRTTSLLLMDAEVYVIDVAPFTFTPFSCH